MSDMLVKLYTLPPVEDVLAEQRAHGVVVRRPLASEKHTVTAWVQQTFDAYWGSECDVAFVRQPASCFMALEQKQILGFACYDATCRNFFGPTGVAKQARGRGIGKALLLACLHAMHAEGYAYAIIGGVGPKEFYRKVVGAVEIEGSTPGIYHGLLSWNAE